jgi:hypothetical protein
MEYSRSLVCQRIIRLFQLIRTTLTIQVQLVNRILLHYVLDQLFQHFEWSKDSYNMALTDQDKNSFKSSSIVFEGKIRSSKYPKMDDSF